MSKTCKTCKYYTEHYVITTPMLLSPIGGHCSYSIQKQLTPTENCVHWEQKEDFSARQQKTLTHYLSEVEKHLNHIKLILSLNQK